MLTPMNEKAFDLLRKEWQAIDAELPEDLRPENIAKETNPEKRWQLVMRLQIEQRRIKVRREGSRRPRPIGPVDRAVRRMEEHYSRTRHGS